MYKAHKQTKLRRAQCLVARTPKSTHTDAIKIEHKTSFQMVVVSGVVTN
jgi:hypothetical protein